MSGIQIENLVKTYGDNIAVNGLNLNLEKGKVYGFLGPNGAGKSTTMNIITGYIGATSGTVKIDGYDIFKEPEKAKKCVGYLPEIPPLYQDMTVKEYLVFVAELKKIPAKEKMKNIKEVLEMTKTTQVENRLIKNLSKGYKQRVGIAQALIGMPEIIILDEPTVGLDPKQIIEIRQLIKELGKNHTVILSSHILSEISEVCEYIFIISNTFLDKGIPYATLAKPNVSTKGHNRGIGLYNAHEIISKYNHVFLDTEIQDKYFVQRLQVSKITTTGLAGGLL